MNLPIAYLPEFRRLDSASPRKDKVAMEIARRIVKDLLDQNKQVDDRLPPESEMLEHYQVARETLREALRLLETQGIIRLKRGPGGGPFVSPVNAAYLARSASLYFHAAGATYEEVFDAWLSLEPGLCARVARQPDREAVEQALRPYTTHGEGMEPDEEAYFKFATGFHALVGSLSGNRVLVLLLQSVNHILTEVMLEDLQPQSIEAQIEHDHSALAEAIIRQHATKAERLSRDHIEHMVESYRGRAAERLADRVDWR